MAVRIGYGVEITGPGGERGYAQLTNLKINEEKLYNFDPETGVLYISIKDTDWDSFKKKIGDIPPEGKEIVLPTPPSTVPGIFSGMKEIKPFPESEVGEYLLKPEDLVKIGDNEYMLKYRLETEDSQKN